MVGSVLRVAFMHELADLAIINYVGIGFFLIFVGNGCTIFVVDYYCIVLICCFVGW